MRAFIGHILSRRNLPVMIGVIALCLVIAVFGGRLVLFGDSPFADFWQRALAVLAIIAIWLGIEGLLWWRQHRADMGVLTHALRREGGGEEADGVDVAEMRAYVRDVMARLRRDHPGYGRQFLMSLPWYLVIGPAGAGKSALIVHSGLNMPLEEGLGRSGMPAPPTVLSWRWWFTDAALFVAGPAGLVQDRGQNAVLQRSWRDVLTFLRRRRSRRPLDGIIVVLPADAVLGDEALEYAATIRRRLQDAMRQFAARLQVYVVISQCDRLLGFTDFFGRLDAEALAQPLGVTLPVQGDTASLRERLQRLVDSVGEQLPSRTAIEPDPTARARMALLPEQLAGVTDAASRFIAELTAAGRTGRTLLLRGVFLTSAGQPGEDVPEPIDAWAGRFGQPAGLAAVPRRLLPAGSGPYFLNGLFQHFIIPEAGLAGGSLRGAGRAALLNGTGYAVCLLLLLLLAGWWSYDYTSHTSSLQAMRTSVAAERAMLPTAVPQNGLAAVLPLLDEAQRLSQFERVGDGEFWLVDVTPLSISAAHQASMQNYRSALQTLLLPALLDRLEAQLRQAVSSGANRPQVRSLLTTYLMFSDPGHYQRATVAAWTGALVQADLAFDPQKRIDAQAHITRLLNLMPLPVSLDQSLIANARAELREQPDADAIYARLKNIALSSANAPPVDIENALGSAGSQLLMLRSQAGLPVVVPGLYTRDGFYQIFLTQAPALATGLDASDWVMGSSGGGGQQGVQAVLQAVTRLYVQDYIKQWQSVISQISLRALPDLASLSGGLQTMAGPDSPLIQLVNLIKRQTDLDPPPAPASGLVAEATKVAGAAAGAAAASAAQQAVSLAAPLAVPTDAQNWPGNAIRVPFVPLQSMLDARSGQTPALRMQNTLAAAYGVVAGVASAQAPDAAAQQIAGQVLSAQGADPLIAVRVQAATLPKPIDGIFRQIYSSTWGILLQMTVDRIQATWARDVAPVCEQALARRFPFVSAGDPGVGRDVTVRDFSSFFGPNGTMDKFTTTNLAMFTTPGADGRLTLASQNGLSLGLAGGAMDQINRARQIRNLFFGPDGNLLVRFSLTPSYLDPRVLSATVLVDQTSMVYRHEPPRATMFTWPPTGDGGASFSITTINKDTYQIQNDGLWAVYQLLQGAAPLSNGNQSTLTVTFKLQDYQTNYLLRTDSVSNPFVNRDFMAFRCVPRL